MAEHRPRGLVAALGVVLALLLSACSSGAETPVAESGFVRTDGQRMTLDGSTFRFVGFNLFDAAASDIYSCSPDNRLNDSELAAMLRYARDEAGATVIRFWAYQTYTDSGTDFSGVDRFVKAAGKLGLKVMPVLEDGPGYCSTGKTGTILDKADDGRWYSAGYRQPYGTARLSFRDYARVMAKHYRDNTTILGWSMVNEAESIERDAQGKSVLVDFARDVAGVIHAADPNHLVTLSTQSNGAPGASGSDFADVYGLPGLDFSEVHDYAFYGADDAAMPGSQDDKTLPAPDSDACRSINARIACSFAIARQLGKPIIVGETGIKATDASSKERRAEQLEDKMRAAFDAGASGYLVWHLDEKPSAPDDQYAIIPGQDPLFAAMKKVLGTTTKGGS